MAKRQIKPEELGHFSIDEDTNRLYWEDKAVQTESVVVLSGKQTSWGIIIAVATILGALANCVYTGTYLWVTRQNPPGIAVQTKGSASVASPLPSIPSAQTTSSPPSTPHSPEKNTSPKKER